MERVWTFRITGRSALPRQSVMHAMNATGCCMPTEQATDADMHSPNA